MPGEARLISIAKTWRDLRSRVVRLTDKGETRVGGLLTTLGEAGKQGQAGLEGEADAKEREVYVTDQRDETKLSSEGAPR